MDNHKKIIPLLNHTFHYGICISCGDEIILSEHPAGARIKHKCNKCKYLKNKQYQKDYNRKSKNFNDKCKSCNKDIVRSNEYRSSIGNGMHEYFCSNECKNNFPKQKEQMLKDKQANLDPTLVAKLLKEFGS